MTNNQYRTSNLYYYQNQMSRLVPLFSNTQYVGSIDLLKAGASPNSSIDLVYRYGVRIHFHNDDFVGFGVAAGYAPPPRRLPPIITKQFPPLFGRLLEIKPKTPTSIQTGTGNDFFQFKW